MPSFRHFESDEEENRKVFAEETNSNYSLFHADESHSFFRPVTKKVKQVRLFGF